MGKVTVKKTKKRRRSDALGSATTYFRKSSKMRSRTKVADDCDVDNNDDDDDDDDNDDCIGECDNDTNDFLADNEEDDCIDTSAETKNFSSDIKPIRFKACISSIDQPVFPNIVYCFQPVTTTNTLTIAVEELYQFLCKYSFDFCMCQCHGLRERVHPDCLYCTSFAKFNCTFIIRTKYHFLTFPPPSWYQPKVLNFLRTFCHSSCRFMNSASKCNTEKEQELKSYGLFVNMNFNDGSLKDLSTGKTSYVRNSILGFHCLGGRATLSIDCTLSPQTVILPQYMFDAMEMACPLVLVNRAPSLRGTCIYVLEALRNENAQDHTIRINSYICEGLHADQDGDELSIFYLKHPGTSQPSHDMLMAIAEMKRSSWNGGVRHDIAYNPRYEFTQYIRYILHTYDDYFNSINKLWASIRAPPREKCKIAMHLGCSIFPNEIDELVQQISDFIKRLPVQTVKCHDLLLAEGAVKNVVLSGAKGELVHISTYLRHLYSINESRRSDHINYFDKCIHSGTEMSRNGTYQFLFLENVNPLQLNGSNIYVNERLLLEHVTSSTAFACYFFNVKASLYIMNYIANTTTVVNEEAVDAYLENLVQTAAAAVPP